MEHGSDELFFSDSEVKFDEDTVALGGNGDGRKNQDDIWSRPYILGILVVSAISLEVSVD